MQDTMCSLQDPCATLLPVFELPIRPRALHHLAGIKQREHARGVPTVSCRWWKVVSFIQLNDFFSTRVSI